MKKYGLSTIGGIVALIAGLLLLSACDPYDLERQKQYTQQEQARALQEQARSAVGVAQAESITDIVAVLSQPGQISAETLARLALAADARDDASFNAILTLAMEDYNVREAARQEEAAVRRQRRFMLNALTWGWLAACFGGGFFGTMALFTGNRGKYIELPTFKRKAKPKPKPKPDMATRRLTPKAGLDHSDYEAAYRAGRLAGTTYDPGGSRTIENPYVEGSTCCRCWYEGYKDALKARGLA
jgi:hypothetical protein